MSNKTVRNLAIILVLLAVAVFAFLAKERKNKEAVKNQPSKEMPAQQQSAQNIKSNSDQPAALPRLVDLGAGKCIPCKMMAPILEDLKKTHADKFEVQFIDVWQNPDEAKKFSIRVIPTQIFFAPDGKELFRHEGFFGKDDILAKWKEVGF